MTKKEEEEEEEGRREKEERHPKLLWTLQSCILYTTPALRAVFKYTSVRKGSLPLLLPRAAVIRRARMSRGKKVAGETPAVNTTCNLPQP